jgi:serine/threonine-protein kinase
MPAKLHARAKRLFLEVAELPLAEREGYIERETAGDAELAAEVRSLLAFHSERTIMEPVEVAPRRPTLQIAREPLWRKWLWPGLLMFAIVAMAVGTYYQLRRASERLVARGLENLADTSARSVEDWINQWKADAAYFSHDARWNSANPAASFNAILQPYLANHPGTVAALADRQGRIIAGTETFTPGETVAAWSRFDEALSQITFVAPGDSKLWPSRTGPRLAWIFAPLPSGVLILGRDLRFETRRLLIAEGDQYLADAFVFDGRGRMLTGGRHAAELAGDPPELRVRQSTNLTGLAEAALSKTISGAVVKPYVNQRGIPSVGAWRWLPEHRIAIGVETTWNDAFAPVRVLENAYAAMLGLLTLSSGAAILSWIRANRYQKEVRQLGSYRLIRKIGSGGMGEVYLAQHALLKRQAAIKILRPEKISERSIERFEREVQHAADLRNPHTIEVFDFGRAEDGTFFCVMEFVDGISLDTLVAEEGPIDPERAIFILCGICDSLEEAHSCGILHRDIKPQNVMVGVLGGRYDWVKVLDFGLARNVDEADNERGMVAGTPLYMAPERFRPGSVVDTRSDIYSVGAVAYYLLAGREAFEAGPDLVQQILTWTPASPSHYAERSVPRAIERLIYECLDKDPEQRPASIAEFRERLLALRGERPWTESDAREWWAARGR